MWLILAAILLFGAFAPIGKAVTGPTTISVEPSLVEGHVGDIFTVTVYIDKVDNLNAYQFILRFAPFMRVLSVVNVLGGQQGFFLRQGGDTEFSPSVDAFNGIINVGEVLLSTGSVSGSGKLVEITFAVLEAGESALTLESTVLLDNTVPIANEISHQLRHGYYQGPTVDLIRLELADRRIPVGGTQTFYTKVKSETDVPMYTYATYEIRNASGTVTTLDSLTSFVLQTDGYSGASTGWTWSGTANPLLASDDGNYTWAGDMGAEWDWLFGYLVGIPGYPPYSTVVTNEAVGIGDGTTTDFDLANYFVWADSEDIYVDGVWQNKTAGDYTIQTYWSWFTYDYTYYGYYPNKATIEFASAPASGAIITADYVYINWVPPVGTATFPTFAGNYTMAFSFEDLPPIPAGKELRDVYINFHYADILPVWLAFDGVKVEVSLDGGSTWISGPGTNGLWTGQAPFWWTGMLSLRLTDILDTVSKVDNALIRFEYFAKDPIWWSHYMEELLEISIPPGLPVALDYAELEAEFIDIVPPGKAWEFAPVEWGPFTVDDVGEYTVTITVYYSYGGDLFNAASKSWTRFFSVYEP